MIMISKITADTNIPIRNQLPNPNPELGGLGVDVAAAIGTGAGILTGSGIGGGIETDGVVVGVCIPLFLCYADKFMKQDS